MADIVGDNVDMVAEKHLISSLMDDNGYKNWVEASDILQSTSFIADSHQCIYNVVENIYKTHGEIKIDWPTFSSNANAIGLKEFFNDKGEKAYLKELKTLHTETSSVRTLAAKIRKLHIARIMRDQLKNCDEKLAKVCGDEKTSEILNIVEQPLFDFGQLLRGSEKHGPKLIFEDIEKYLDYLEANPVKQIGIPSGFPLWDMSIGGGLINGSVSVIAARVKVGKTMMADNIAFNIVRQNIPVLYLDTEMVSEDHYNRILALVSEVMMNDIKTGQYSLFQNKKQKLRNAAKLLKNLPYHYLNISGQEFEETLADIRRWIVSKVGLNSNGQANPCVVILDYLKLMSASSLKNNVSEHISLGFQMISFVNLCIRYNIPGMTFLQLNRDGINSDETSALAASDRLSWFCSNLSYFKPQSEEEVKEQKARGQSLIYQRKLIPIFARHGGGLDDGDYINIRFRGDIAKIEEGPTKFQLEREMKKSKLVDENDPIVDLDSDDES